MLRRRYAGPAVILLRCKSRQEPILLTGGVLSGACSRGTVPRSGHAPDYNNDQKGGFIHDPWSGKNNLMCYHPLESSPFWRLLA